MKAVIDIGTNTFHLNIAEVSKKGKLTFRYKTFDAVKLGEGGINKGFIAREAYERGIKTLMAYADVIKKYPVSQIHAIATSAVRDAANGEAFIKEVFAKTKININCVTGEQEAKLIYEGTKAAINLKKGCFLIMDIGGGSVEYIICNDEEIFWKQSFNIGAARLMDTFMKNRMLHKEDIKNIKQYLDETLLPVFLACQLFKPKVLIGTAGSFETFAEIISLKKEKIFDPENQKKFKFPNKELIKLLKKLTHSKASERENMKGIVPFRIDMIVIAALITHFVLKKTKINKTILSTYALKEGILLRL